MRPAGCATPGCTRLRRYAGGNNDRCGPCQSWATRHGGQPRKELRPVRNSCDTPGCTRDHSSRGLCHACYQWARVRDWQVPPAPPGRRGEPRVANAETNPKVEE